MKCINEIGPAGLRLPAAALRLAKLEDSGKAEYHVLDNAIVVLKGQMTAMELLNAAESLNKLAAELHTHLANVCGPCDGCGEGAVNGGKGCPMADPEHIYVDLREELLQEAGIPKGTKLCADVNEEEHSITIYAAGCDYDLRDVPRETLEMFRAANVCLGELEERLMVGDPVYGS